MGLQLLKCSPASTTWAILCIPSALSSTGMLAREWKRENSLKRVKILLLWRRTTRKSALRRLRVKEKRKVTATSSERKTLSCAALVAGSLFLRGINCDANCHAEAVFEFGKK